MFNKSWIIKVVIVVSAIGGVLLFNSTAIWQDTPETPPIPSIANEIQKNGPTPSGNPLLTATYAQFQFWVPRYPSPCNQMVFNQRDPENRDFNDCLDLIIDRVAKDTNVKLSRTEVLDAKVQTHWNKVMGG